MITHASANDANAIGKPLEAVLDQAVVAATHLIISSNRLKSSARTVLNGIARNAVIHRVSDQCIAIELESIVGDSPQIATDNVQRAIDQIKSCSVPDELLRVLTGAVRAMTGYDRVMAYRFDDEWNGNVVVDERQDEMPSWLGFRYPASDIPAPARELFSKNWSRIIPTSDFIPVPVLPEASPESPDALDLTFSTLRAPSPVHVEYLKNMQVGGSFTLSLLCNGRLWGMIACHHRTPLFVNFPSREAAELLVIAASAQLSSWETRDSQNAEQRMKLLKQWLQAAVDGGDDPTDVLIEKSNLLIELTESSGVAIIKADELIRLGKCPEESELRKILEQVKTFCTPVYSIRTITHLMPSASTATGSCAGVLALKVTRRFEDQYILWFRPELLHEVTWGGDPRKPPEQPDGPRKSFAAWKELIRHTSSPWAKPTIDFAEQLGVAITEAERASRPL